MVLLHTKGVFFGHYWVVFDCIVVTSYIFMVSKIYDDVLPVLFIKHKFFPWYWIDLFAQGQANV
jgi:hypothetical protein